MNLTKEQLLKADIEPVSEHDLITRYEEMLNDAYGLVNIAGCDYQTSNILKKVDPIAFRCGFNDWIDSELSDERLIELDGEYFNFDDVKGAK